MTEWIILNDWLNDLFSAFICFFFFTCFVIAYLYEHISVYSKEFRMINREKKWFVSTKKTILHISLGTKTINFWVLPSPHKRFLCTCELALIYVNSNKSLFEFTFFTHFFVFRFVNLWTDNMSADRFSNAVPPEVEKINKKVLRSSLCGQFVRKKREFRFNFIHKWKFRLNIEQIVWFRLEAQKMLLNGNKKKQNICMHFTHRRQRH